MRKLPKSFTTVTPFSKGVALAILILGPFIGFGFGRSYQIFTQKITNYKTNAASNLKGGCSSVLVNGYEGVGEHKIDLVGNKTDTFVRLYIKPSENMFYKREAPIMIRVFSMDAIKNCLIEDFSTTIAANEFKETQVVSSFWGDLRDVLVITTSATPTTEVMTEQIFLVAYVDKKFQIVTGPKYDQLGSYAFKKENSTIWVTLGIYPENEAVTNPHRFKVLKYIWNGKGYTENIVGETKEKYFAHITEIMEKEPDLFK